MFVISRVEFYKFSQCSAVVAESDRKLIGYDNPDWDSSRTAENVYLVSPSFSESIDSYILQRKKELKCRLTIDSSLPEDKQSNVLGQVLFSASKDFFSGMSQDDILLYYSRCLDFFTKRYPTVEVVSAVVHFDETTPHLHLNFLPLASKLNSKGILKTSFSSSALFRGKEAFRSYQDDFFECMDKLYPHLQLSRKGEESRSHLTVKEYKALKDQNNPTLQLRLENADLKRKYSVCYDCLAYLLRMFPKLKPYYQKFFGRSDIKNFER